MRFASRKAENEEYKKFYHLLWEICNISMRYLKQVCMAVAGEVAGISNIEVIFYLMEKKKNDKLDEP